MFTTKFSGNNKIGGHCPRMPPVATGLIGASTPIKMHF